MSQEPPVVLISPEARAALTTEFDRTSFDDLTGGLLFGYPIDEGQRLIVSSVRLTSDVGFGQREFSLDQTRTSRQLEHARSLDPQATYCGVWYLHRTPSRELTAEEWVQTQTLLEDPDFPFKDLVCLMLCSYGGKLGIYASSFTRHQSARGQTPTPTELRLTTDWLSTPTPRARPPGQSPPTDWYKSPRMAARVNQEHQRLAQKYHVEPALAPDGQMFFRLSPKLQYDQLAFYLAVGPGFPDKAPHVFLLIGGKPYRIAIPSLGSWSEKMWLVELADEVVGWLAFSIDDYMKAAERALGRANRAEAVDLLKLVLAIDPRTPGAARLLAKAQTTA